MFNIISHWGNANQNHNEIPLHTHQNSYNQKNGQLQVLERMWINWNLHILLVGM